MSLKTISTPPNDCVQGVNAFTHLLVSFLGLYLIIEQLDNERWMIVASIGYLMTTMASDAMFNGSRMRGPASVIVAVGYILGW